MILRNLFLYLSQQATLRRFMETSSAAKPLTRRFIAGETLEAELDVVASLAALGIDSAMDHLGENVTQIEDATKSVQAYLEALEQIGERKAPATVSLKLTQLGLDLSNAECLANLRSVAQRAKAIGTRVEIDMESSVYTQHALDIVKTVFKEYGNLRCVIQAYLFRSEADIGWINQIGMPVRLCKGAYNESPKIAIPDKDKVDDNYIRLMHLLLDHGHDPAIATHDERMIEEAKRYAIKQGITKNKFEFQMLHGIRRDLQQSLMKDGYRVRVYVPYGAAWYPYFMRRLAERPANLWFVLKSLLR